MVAARTALVKRLPTVVQGVMVSGMVKHRCSSVNIVLSRGGSDKDGRRGRQCQIDLCLYLMRITCTRVAILLGVFFLDTVVLW